VSSVSQRCVFLFLNFLLVSTQLYADTDDALTVSLLTFSPGDHAFFKFGHNALWIHDSKNHTDDVYNFGTFYFDSWKIFPEFLLGRFQYWLSVEPLDVTIASYKEDNRWIEAQELQLSREEKALLNARLIENARPENAAYKYDYYRDNCSTRLRDAINNVTGGVLRASGQVPARMTWRDHTRRATADTLWEYFGLDILMNDVIDQPINVWQEAFLPENLQQLIRQTKVKSENSEIPLVRREFSLLAAHRPQMRRAPPHWLGFLSLIGIIAGSIVFLLGKLSRRHPIARIVLGLCVSILGGCLGLLGIIFTLLWVFTDHQVAAHNENILLCAPFAVLLFVYGIRVAQGAVSAYLKTYWLIAASAALSVLSLILKLFPWFDQNNYQIIALLLPLWMGLCLALRQLSYHRLSHVSE